MRHSRNSIRRQLLIASGGRTILPRSDQLPIPESLRRYLKFEDQLAAVDQSVPLSDSANSDANDDEANFFYDNDYGYDYYDNITDNDDADYGRWDVDTFTHDDVRD